MNKLRFWVRTSVTTLIAILVATLSNWFYDLFKQYGLFTERPSLTNIICVIIIFVPLIYLQIRLQSQPQDQPSGFKTKITRRQVKDVIGKTIIGAFCGILLWYLIPGRGISIIISSGILPEISDLPKIYSVSFVAGLWTAFFGSLIGSCTGGIIGTFGWIYFGKFDETLSNLLDLLFKNWNPFSEPFSKVVSGAVLGSCCGALFGMMFMPVGLIVSFCIELIKLSS